MYGPVIVFCKNPTEKKKEKYLFADISESSKVFCLDFHSFFKVVDKNGNKFIKFKSTQLEFVFSLISQNNLFSVRYETVENRHLIKEIMHMDHLLPADSYNFVSALKNYIVQNFGLKLNKTPFYHNGKFHYGLNQNGLKNLEKFLSRSDYYTNLLESLSVKNSKEFGEYFSNKLKSFKATTRWRMVTGLGGESVYKNDMTLHPVFGFPYIPGQAIKGVVRSWIIQEIFNKIEKNAFESKLFCDIFGCPEESYYKKEHKGQVTFLSANPLGNIHLQLEVMTPHYGKYYEPKNTSIPPADYLSPVPLFFLTVCNTEFQFFAGCNNKNPLLNDYINIGEADDLLVKHFKDSNTKIEDPTMLDLVEYFMKDVIELRGIGAKTSVGYGRFNT